MEDTSNLPKQTSSTKMEQKDDDQFEEFFQSLHKEESVDGYPLARYHGFWFDADLLQGILTFEKHFQAKDSDIMLATFPKSGTTWLKALTFSIVNRCKHSVAESPLLFANPHQLVPFFELNLYISGKIPDINSFPCPRILSTHVPYQCLPKTVLDSPDCRIIYLCRNPLDTVTSLLHFSLQNGIVPKPQQSVAMDGFFKVFCEGKYKYGPFWDHILGFWNASLKNPQKVLFLKYEDLKKDVNSSVKKIANFLGYPFSAEEEKNGLVEEIKRLCSLENLKNLEVNKKGEIQAGINIKHSSFFRKGRIGDWVNHLTPSIAEQIQKLMEEKFTASGLEFEIYDKSES